MYAWVFEGTALVGEPAPPKLVEQVLARGEGNPFFTEELVAAHLAGEGLPAVLSDLIASDMSELADDARAVLAAVAALALATSGVASPQPAGADPPPSSTCVTTAQLALGATGRQGPLDLRANAGFHHVENAGHERGRTADRFEGRLQATLGFTTGGTLR